MMLILSRALCGMVGNSLISFPFSPSYLSGSHCYVELLWGLMLLLPLVWCCSTVDVDLVIKVIFSSLFHCCLSLCYLPLVCCCNTLTFCVPEVLFCFFLSLCCSSVVLIMMGGPGWHYLTQVYTRSTVLGERACVTVETREYR